MILNENAFLILKDECGAYERGMSSYWKERLKDFEFLGNEFTGRELPEGKGGKKTALRRSAHYLLQFPFRRQGKRFREFKKILSLAYTIHERRNTQLALGTMRQVLTLAFLQDQLTLTKFFEPIIIIGDGFGIMSSLILSYLPNAKQKVVVVNLTPNLLIDAVFIKKSLPDLNMSLVKTVKEYHRVLENPEISIVLIQADNAHIISQASIGLAINIVSMQEMEPPVIGDYFYFLRSSPNSKTYFYCCNRLEKTLSDKVIVRFFEYPWHPNDQILIDNRCPWHRYHYNLRPPFYHAYDGPIQHRLVLMHKILSV